MLLKLFLAFTLIPLVELYLLVTIGTEIGVGSTFFIVFSTGILGAWLAKTQGTQTIAKAWKVFNSGSIPTEELLNALLIFVAGVVLITPGFLTDIAGFLLLTPIFRKLVYSKVTTKLVHTLNKNRESESR